MPTTFQLTARLDHPQIATTYEGCYSYDEPALGIIAEPLVPSTTAVIQHVFGTPHPRDRTCIRDKHSASSAVLSFSTERTQLPADTDTDAQAPTHRDVEQSAEDRLATLDAA